MMRLWMGGAIAAMAVGLAPAAALTPITVAYCGGPLSGYSWQSTAVAEEMGWLGDLDVSIVGLPGSPVCINAVLSGEVDAAEATMESLVLAHPSPLKMVYLAFQTGISELAVLESGPIQLVQDLRGKTIGASTLQASFMVQFRALARQAGLDPDTDLTYVVLAPGQAQADALNTGAVDALAGFNIQFLQARGAGAALRNLDFGPAALFPGNGIVVTEETLAQRRDDIVTLAQARAKASIFIAANPEAAARIVFERHPEFFTGQTLDQAAPLLIAIARVFAPVYSPETTGVAQWGAVSESRYADLVAFDLDNAGLSAPVALEAVFTPELLEAVNAFDAEAIAEMARTYP